MARWARVRVPTAYDGCSFDTFEAVPGTATALAVCRQWAKELRAGTDLRQGLLPARKPRRRQDAPRGGDPPRNRRERQAQDGALPQRPRLAATRCGRATATASPPSPSGYKLVVLDDLGAEDWTSWARDRIYNLVNQREQQRGLVIVTTNHDWATLAGRVGGPTASRLRKLAREVHVDAREDFRERDALSEVSDAPVRPLREIYR